jgi:hypothetical protein
MTVNFIVCLIATSTTGAAQEHSRRCVAAHKFTAATANDEMGYWNFTIS